MQPKSVFIGKGPGILVYENGDVKMWLDGHRDVGYLFISYEKYGHIWKLSPDENIQEGIINHYKKMV